MVCMKSSVYKRACSNINITQFLELRSMGQVSHEHNFRLIFVNKQL